MSRRGILSCGNWSAHSLRCLEDSLGPSRGLLQASSRRQPSYSRPREGAVLAFTIDTSIYAYIYIIVDIDLGGVPMSSQAADRFIPLKPNWFHILLTLTDGPSHGYAIMQDVSDRTGGKLRLWPATLYGSMRRLEDAGLIAADVKEGGDEGDDPRRRYYAITGFGSEVLSHEVARLKRLVDLAYDRKVKPA